MVIIDHVSNCLIGILEYNELCKEELHAAVACFPGYEIILALRLLNANLERAACLLPLLPPSKLRSLWDREDYRILIIKYCHHTEVVEEMIMESKDISAMVSFYEVSPNEEIRSIIFDKLLDECKYDDFIMKTLLRGASSNQLTKAWLSREWGHNHLRWFVGNYFAVPEALRRYMNTPYKRDNALCNLARLTNQAEVLELLSNSFAGGVRQAVAINENCPRKLLEKLSLDINPSVAKSAIAAKNMVYGE